MTVTGCPQLTWYLHAYFGSLAYFELSLPSSSVESVGETLHHPLSQCNHFRVYHNELYIGTLLSDRLSNVVVFYDYPLPTIMVIVHQDTCFKEKACSFPALNPVFLFHSSCAWSKEAE